LAIKKLSPILKVLKVPKDSFFNFVPDEHGWILAFEISEIIQNFD
jgi:hypothetical protein